MFWFKKAPKAPEGAAPVPLKYELSDEAKETIRANILRKERLLQHARAVNEYTAQVRAEIRLEQGYVCTCDDEWAGGCDVHDS